MSLVLPTKFDKQSLDLFAEINSGRYPNIVSQAYGSVSGDFSSRESHRITSLTFEDLTDHMNKLDKIEIQFWYAINAACIYGDKRNFKHIISDAYDAGVDCFIVANPEIMLYLRKEYGNNIAIKSSVIVGIDTIQKFEYYENLCDVITIATDANRNFKFLNKIKDYKYRTELMVNESCLYSCPLRSFHYMREGHNLPATEVDMYVKECYEMMSTFELVKSRWIRPEDLNYYKQYASLFKISGRSMPFDFIQRNAMSYGAGKTINDNLLDIFPIVTGSIENEQSGKFETRKISAKKLDGFLDYFVKNGDKCSYNCPCNYCKKIADNIDNI